MGPVWEANHVWLIFVLVVFWTAFPVAFGSVASTLYIPLFLAAIGIILRGVAFATRGVARGRTLQRARLPAALRPVLGAHPLLPGRGRRRGRLGTRAGGQRGRRPADELVESRPRSLIGALAVVTGAYLAAVYLAADARAGRRRRPRPGASGAGRSGRGSSPARSPSEASRCCATTRGPSTTACSTTACRWWCCPRVAGLATLALVWRRLYGYARLTAALAVGASCWGWVVAQHPCLPARRAHRRRGGGRAATRSWRSSSARSLGAVVLIPSLAYLFRLFLAGRLDKEGPTSTRAGGRCRERTRAPPSSRSPAA